METIELLDAYDYPKVVNAVLRGGQKRVSRGRATLDLGVTTVTVKDPTIGLATGTGRGLSPRVAAAEAVQLIGGFHDPDLMLWASPNFGNFMDRKGSELYFHGAYGERIGRQMLRVKHKLSVDPGTRQAVVTLWDPAKDNYLGHKDYPCTVGFGFDITNGELHMNTVMRSNDAWLGFPYDLFQFTQLQLTLARVLDIGVGTYTHTAWSFHLYEDDLDKATTVLRPRTDAVRSYQPQGIGKVGKNSMWLAMNRAVSLAAKDNDVFSTVTGLDMTESERWYAKQFEAFTGFDMSRGSE